MSAVNADRIAIDADELASLERLSLRHKMPLEGSVYRTTRGDFFLVTAVYDGPRPGEEAFESMLVSGAAHCLERSVFEALADQGLTMVHVFIGDGYDFRNRMIALTCLMDAVNAWGHRTGEKFGG